MGNSSGDSSSGAVGPVVGSGVAVYRRGTPTSSTQVRNVLRLAMMPVPGLIVQLRSECNLNIVAYVVVELIDLFCCKACFGRARVEVKS